MLQLSLSLCDKYDGVYHAREATVFSLFPILRGFLTDLCDGSEFFSCLIEASLEIQRKINYLLR